MKNVLKKTTRMSHITELTILSLYTLTHFMPLVSFYTLKTSEHSWFSGVFTGYRKTRVAWDGLRVEIFAEKTSLLAGAKTVNFLGFFFTIRSCIMNFVEFIFTIVRFKSRK